jgi:hypothetical protein
MIDQIPIDRSIDLITQKLRETLGVRGKNLKAALGKARRRLPRRIYRQAMVLARAEPLAGHPKLCLTLDRPALEAAAFEVRAHLESIDLADQRKGWWLGMLGSLSFNLILMCTLVICLLVWNGAL